ncbi:MAG: phosphoribosylanthranilate isomerase [Lachnospiraceae bacterium]|nr:phosphoribosylanthranilate isomerase [Lachnospiraceae bacterium]
MISEFNESERMRGKEIKAYNTLSEETRIKIIKAYKIATDEDVRKASVSTADMILLDSGAGSGKEFDWSLLKEMTRPYFLAGGLDPTNAADAIEKLSPYALDVSSGIETDGFKDREKMRLFMKSIGRI